MEWHRRWRGVTPRRGQRWSPPWPFVEAPAPPEVPARFIRARRRAALPARRGASWVPPPEEAAAPQAPERPAEFIRARQRRGQTARRGQRFEPPWPTAEAPAPPEWTPVFLAPWRPRPAVTRRGAWFAPPWLPPPWTPAFLRSRPRRPPSLRRRHLCEPPWVTAEPPAPGEFLPPRLAARRRPPALPVRRPSRFDPPWPFVEAPPAPAPNVFSQLYDQHGGAVAYDADAVPGQTSPEPVEAGAIEYHSPQIPGGVT